MLDGDYYYMSPPAVEISYDPVPPYIEFFVETTLVSVGFGDYFLVFYFLIFFYFSLLTTITALLASKFAILA